MSNQLGIRVILHDRRNLPLHILPQDSQIYVLALPPREGKIHRNRLHQLLLDLWVGYSVFFHHSLG